MEEKIKQYSQELAVLLQEEAQKYIDSSINQIIDQTIESLKKLKKNSKRSTDQLLSRIKELEGDLQQQRDLSTHYLTEMMAMEERNKSNCHKLQSLQLKYNSLEKQRATSRSLPVEPPSTDVQPILKLEETNQTEKVAGKCSCESSTALPRSI